MSGDIYQWLLACDEPWTRYRTLVDLLDRPEEDATGRVARADMLAHPKIQGLIATAGTWPGYAFRRHNDARHPIYACATLADFGVRADDPGMPAAIKAVTIHQATDGAFESLIQVPKAFGGSGEDVWAWMACDAPTLLYSLLAMGARHKAQIEGAVEHLVSLAHHNGWRCAAAQEFGKFRGPGRRDDPCPIANVYALKALSLVPGLFDTPAAHAGAEMLLSHWAEQRQKKYYLFGIGTDFRKLKYPFVWYDILHVVDVLGRYPHVRSDPRYLELVAAITEQADADGRYTARSMYQAWRGWSFADKKNPSPWLTFLVLRVLRRVHQPQ